MRETNIDKLAPTRPQSLDRLGDLQERESQSYSIFISSADSYADLWPIFFDLFVRYWPSYRGVIYLNTETLDFEFPGLDIVCTRVGSLGRFGKVIRAGLDALPTDNVLLVMIDYLFMGMVDEVLVGRYFDFFVEQDLDTFCFVRNPYQKTVASGSYDFEFVIPPSRDMFSYQVAFWKKPQLKKMALPHETPWLSEWYGTARANQMRLRLAFPRNSKAIPYLPEGALHKGKWVPEMVNLLRAIEYPVDFSRRGYFVETGASPYGRVRGRMETFWPRCLSVLDLMKQRLIG